MACVSGNVIPVSVDTNVFINDKKRTRSSLNSIVVRGTLPSEEEEEEKEA